MLRPPRKTMGGRDFDWLSGSPRRRVFGVGEGQESSHRRPAIRVGSSRCLSPRIVLATFHCYTTSLLDFRTLDYFSIALLIDFFLRVSVQSLKVNAYKSPWFFLSQCNYQVASNVVSLISRLSSPAPPRRSCFSIARVLSNWPISLCILCILFNPDQGQLSHAQFQCSPYLQEV
jgi:hypothetical protein